MSEGYLPSVESNRLAVAGWIVAAIPVFVSALQAVARITGSKVGGWPVLGGVADYVHSVEIFRLMSLSFDSSEPVVLLLFVLISASLTLVGVSLLRPETAILNYSDSFHRAVSLVSAVMFGILYASMYADLWQRSLSVQQRSVLVLFPLSTFGGIFVAYWAQPQTNAYRLLDKAEREVKAELEEFDSRATKLTSSLDDLPEGFGADLDAKSAVDSRRTVAFEDLLEKIDDYRNRSITTTERESIARKLYDEEADGLNGIKEYEEIETELRETIANTYRDRHVDLTIDSETFDRPYEIINRDSYRSFEVDTSIQSRWGRINVNALDDVAAEIADGDEEIDDVVAVIEATDTHLKEVGSDLRSKEEEFAEIVEDTREIVETIVSRVDGFPGEIGDRLNEIYVLGHLKKYDTIGMIDDDYGVTDSADGKVNQAIEAHHACQFSDATHAAQEAKEMAEHLDEVTKFIDHILDAADDGVSGVEIPDLTHFSYNYFDESLIENELGTRMNGVRMVCEWDDDRIGLNYPGETPTSTTSSTSSSGDDEDDDVIPRSQLNRGVEFVLDGITTGEIGEVEDHRVAVRRSNLPGIYDDEEILEATADYLEAQEELIPEVERESLPEHLEFKINPDREVRITMEETIERFDNHNKHTN